MSVCVRKGTSTRGYTTHTHTLLHTIWAPTPVYDYIILAVILEKKKRSATRQNVVS